MTSCVKPAVVVAAFVISLAIGFLFAIAFTIIFRRRESAPGFLLAFLLFFFVAWAGVLWLRPLGPPLFGVYLLPGLVVTLLSFLLVPSFAQRTPRTKREAREQIEARETAEATIGFLFWFLVVGLAVAVIIAHVAPGVTLQS
jgi:hypothetical protein